MADRTECNAAEAPRQGPGERIPYGLVCDGLASTAVCRAVCNEAGARTVPEAAAALLRNGQPLAATAGNRLLALAEVTT